MVDTAAPFDLFRRHLRPQPLPDRASGCITHGYQSDASAISAMVAPFALQHRHQRSLPRLAAQRL
jgi:hypothetical protein